jgi:hypothetical protein
MKCGTTSLYYFFSEHPDAFVSSVKEMHFYDREANYKRGGEFYDRFFTGYNGEHTIVDATPFYSIFPDIPQRIKDTKPDSRLIFIFRNPVERAYSHFWQCYRNGWKWDDIMSALKEPGNRFLLAMGCYGEMVKNYLEVFPREQMLFLLTDELKSDPVSVRRKCYAHAGIDPDFLPTGTSDDVRNPATLPRSLMLQRAAYNILIPGMHPNKRYHYDQDGFITSETLPKLTPATKLPYRLYRAIRRRNIRPSKYPPLDALSRKKLTEMMKDDIELLSKITGLELTHWLKCLDQEI